MAQPSSRKRDKSTVTLPFERPLSCLGLEIVGNNVVPFPQSVFPSC